MMRSTASTRAMVSFSPSIQMILPGVADGTRLNQSFVQRERVDLFFGSSEEEWRYVSRNPGWISFGCLGTLSSSTAEPPATILLPGSVTGLRMKGLPMPVGLHPRHCPPRGVVGVRWLAAPVLSPAGGGAGVEVGRAPLRRMH